jgi:hypothetical protein
MLWGGVRLLKSYLCGQGAIRRYAGRRRDCADDEPADVVGGIPRCRGEWFLMWQSQIWNGQEGHQNFTIRCGVFGCGAREPTPD